MAKETAEQKLLNIIEATEAKESGGEKPAVSPASEDVAVQVAASVKGAGISLSVAPILEQLLGLIKGKPTLGAERAPFGLKDVNRILALAIVVIAVFMVIDFMSGIQFSRRKVNITAQKASAMPEEELLPVVKEVDAYIAEFARRDIFKPYEESQQLVDQSIPAEKRLIQEQTKNLKLVGVSWLDTPESASALIENTQNGMTYFLQVGDTVNKVEIKKIYAESVTLTFSGQELELNL